MTEVMLMKEMFERVKAGVRKEDTDAIQCRQAVRH